MKKPISFLFIALIIASASALFAQTNENSNTNSNSYGEGVSLGISIGGGSLVGVPLRIRLGEKLVGEVGFFYRPVILIDQFTDNIKIEHGLLLAGGLNVFLSDKLLEHKGKYRKQGLFLKGGHSFSSFSDSIIAVGWANETFRINNPSHSFIFELGPGASFNHWVDDPANYLYTANKVTFLIYVKVHWNWFL